MILKFLFIWKYGTLIISFELVLKKKLDINRTKRDNRKLSSTANCLPGNLQQQTNWSKYEDFVASVFIKRWYCRPIVEHIVLTSVSASNCSSPILTNGNRDIETCGHLVGESTWEHKFTCESDQVLYYMVSHQAVFCPNHLLKFTRYNMGPYDAVEIIGSEEYFRSVGNSGKVFLNKVLQTTNNEILIRFKSRNEGYLFDQFTSRLNGFKIKTKCERTTTG